MLFLTRWFGVTGSDGDRSPAREQSDIKEITERVLLMQANAASRQRRPLRRGTHAKGICARAEFEVFDVTVGRDPKLAMRLDVTGHSTPDSTPLGSINRARGPAELPAERHGMLANNSLEENFGAGRGQEAQYSRHNGR